MSCDFDNVLLLSGLHTVSTRSYKWIKNIFPCKISHRGFIYTTDKTGITLDPSTSPLFLSRMILEASLGILQL